MTNKLKKTIISSVPYVFIGLFATKLDHVKYIV